MHVVDDFAKVHVVYFVQSVNSVAKNLPGGVSGVVLELDIYCLHISVKQSSVGSCSHPRHMRDVFNQIAGNVSKVAEHHVV